MWAHNLRLIALRAWRADTWKSLEKDVFQLSWSGIGSWSLT